MGDASIEKLGIMVTLETWSCLSTFRREYWNFFFFLVAPTLGSLLPLMEYRAEFPQFLDQGQSVGLPGRVIRSSQGLYLYTNTEKHTHIHKH
jgi:hypothetical protein